ncbi:uncharacterized protein A4U43_C01F22440 [Asparagus officinalis]|uniref:Amine oxidase domain-containing protein n=1 Tax=Asparagus officinalis TaxID=4686 RepID=A0A5P1FTU2_ASPOF|nr:uncharacterized protein A4U43_C01F22440 [Asparagus officinalis]
MGRGGGGIMEVEKRGGMRTAIKVETKVEDECNFEIKVTSQGERMKARDQVRGNVTTVDRGGYLWEEGPNSFQPSDPVLSMAVDSGLKDELVFGDPDSPRFVLWNGKLGTVPSKPTDFPFFDLMSIGDKRQGWEIK